MYPEGESAEMIRHLMESRPIDEYNGRSSREMYYMIFNPFTTNSPISVPPNIPVNILFSVPFFKQVLLLLEMVQKIQAVKLTKHGNLPESIINELYKNRYIFDDLGSLKFSNYIKKTDSYAVTNPYIIAGAAGLVKKRNNILTLTRKCENYLSKEKYRDLYYDIFEAFTTKFNWAYNDKYESQNIAQYGFAFSLDLLNTFGVNSLPFSFYSEQYYNAFGSLSAEFENSSEFSDPKESFLHCYQLRTLERFFIWFGLAEINYYNEINKHESTIQKSPLFNYLVTIDNS